MSTNKRSFWQRFKKLIIGFTVFLLLMVAFAAWLGFNKVPGHLRRLWSFFEHGTFRNVEDDPAYGAGNTTTVAVDEALPAPMEPIDTIYWKRVAKEGGYVPDGVKQDMDALKKIDFSKLVSAPDGPTSAQAQEALVRRLGSELINLLKDHDAHIRVGKCYTAALDPNAKNKELTRVTAMVCAFDSKNNNLMNISQPLGIVYDFVKYEADPDTWYVTDFSQTIPYDYKLNKK